MSQSHLRSLKIQTLRGPGPPASLALWSCCSSQRCCYESTSENLMQWQAVKSRALQNVLEHPASLLLSLSLCTRHPSQPLPVFLSLSYCHTILHDLLSWHIEKICILWCFQVSRCLASYILIYRYLMGARPCTHSPPRHARTIWCFLQV